MHELTTDENADKNNADGNAIGTVGRHLIRTHGYKNAIDADGPARGR